MREVFVCRGRLAGACRTAIRVTSGVNDQGQNYKVTDIDDLKPRMKLTGCNWLGTIQPQWMNYDSNKKYDISCMFSWGDIENFEHDIQTNIPYDDHRRILLEKLEKTNYDVVRRESGVRIPQQQFYQN